MLDNGLPKAVAEILFRYCDTEDDEMAHMKAIEELRPYLATTEMPISDEEAEKHLVHGYCKDQFDNQEDNIGCNRESIRAAWEALKPHLRTTEPVCPTCGNVNSGYCSDSFHLSATHQDEVLFNKAEPIDEKALKKAFGGGAGIGGTITLGLQGARTFIEVYEDAKAADQPVDRSEAQCSGCGEQAMVRVHLIGDTMVCPKCIHLMMNIVENEAPEAVTWHNKREYSAALDENTDIRGLCSELWAMAQGPASIEEKEDIMEARLLSCLAAPKRKAGDREKAFWAASEELTKQIAHNDGGGFTSLREIVDAAIAGFVGNEMECDKSDE